MRRRGGSEASFDTGAADRERLAAWDGLLGRAGPTVVIRAARAGDAVEHPETLQVA